MTAFDDEAVWQVQVGRGWPTVSDGAPVVFGDDQLVIGANDVTVPLCYGPVRLAGGVGNLLYMRTLRDQADVAAEAATSGSWAVAMETEHRRMLVSSIRFTTGEIIVEGLELNDAGTPTHGQWIISPYFHTDDRSEPAAPGPADLVEQLQTDVVVLARIGRMYLDALDEDPGNAMLTLPEALGVTDVRDAVERAEATAYEDGDDSDGTSSS